MSMIRITDVSKSYRRGSETVRAVRGASVELDRAEYVALSGPSGSGKTTLVNMLAAWEDPDEGQITTDLSEAWSDIAIVPQHLGLLEELSVRENIELPLRLAGRSGTVDELVGLLGLELHLDRRIHELSLGEQQRTAVARAMVLGSSFIVADEPTSHQDEEWAFAIASSLRRSSRAGACVLITTHDSRILPMFDRRLTMSNGTLTET